MVGWWWLGLVEAMGLCCGLRLVVPMGGGRWLWVCGGWVAR